MKILGFEFGAPKPTMEVKESYQSFGTPFGQIGNGNLALPRVDSAMTVNNYVWFGSDNLYPSVITQMYYTSPLHSSIVNFKVNAVLGGGFELTPDNKNNLADEVELKTMMILMRVTENSERALLDLILHNRVYFKIHFDGSRDFRKAEYIGAEKVRKDKESSIYYINNDWSRGNFKTEEILPYNKKNFSQMKGSGCLLYCYEKRSVGQDVYPLPSYTSAMNWCFLDGEMSTLQKEYIVNGIFPSYAISFPQKPATNEEKEELKQTIHGNRGAGKAGKIWTFFGRGKESVPDIQVVPVSNLDNAFQATTESIDSKICQAHTIDPILMGIRVSGKLGSGSDIKQAYTIFEKNIVMPLRKEVEHIFNDLLAIARVKGKMVINKYEIVNETIVETETGDDRKVIDALNSMSPLLATKVLESMTENEIRLLAGLKPVKGGDIPKNQTQIPTQQ